MRTYASTTTVSVEKTISEIHGVVAKYKAEGFGFAFEDNKTGVYFRIKGSDSQPISVRIVLEVPHPGHKMFLHDGRNRRRTAAQIMRAHEQVRRSRHRSLLMIIRAKLEAVSAGISTVEREFLADTVAADGRTIAQHVQEQKHLLAQAGSRLLLPGGA